MQLFNRDGAHVSATLSGNIAVGSGATFRDLFDCQIEINHCIFCAMYTQNGYYANGKGYVLEFICDRQLSSADYSVSYEEKNSTTGDTTQRTFSLSQIGIGSFTNNMNATNAVRVAISSVDITKANATATERQLWRYRFSNVQQMVGGSNNMPVQTNFILSIDGAPCILCDANYENPQYTYTNHCYGQYLGFSSGTPRLELSGYYYEQSAWDSWVSSSVGNAGDYGNFGLAQLVWLWVQANGNLNTDFDIDTPFNPLPTDFYIAVNAYSNHADAGQQTIDFTWSPQNIEELNIDLSNVQLHFDFFMTGGYDWETSVAYSENSFSTSYKTLLENLEIPWYRNVLNKLPLPSQEINTTISVLIWWSDPTGNAGKCRYEIKYDGTNSITVDKMQDETSGYWTYLTADDNDPNQPYDGDPNPYDDLSGFGGGTDAVNGSALLTTSYALSVSGAHDFGNWLWGTGLDLSQLKMVVNNPIENIVSCKLFPFSLSGTASTVKLGNLTSPVNAFLLPENVARTFDMGTVTVHRKYNSFLDYAPYTTVRIYLPYLGLHELDTNVVMGQTIRVKYYVDLVTGHCRAIVFLDGATKKKIQQIDGMIGQGVPVVGSNRAQVEAGYIVGGAQAVANFVGGIGSAIMGNIGSGIADIGNAVKGGLQTAMQQYHTYTSGTPSPALSRFDEQKICIFVDRPVYTEPDKFKHQNGKMCNLTCKLGTLSGYTVIDNTVDLSSIPCNKEERDELLKLLTSGIYL